MMSELLLYVMDRFLSQITSGQQSNWSAHPTNHTVPYGTARLGRAVPGTSCQATIMQSLRDIFLVDLKPRHRANHISDSILHLRNGDSSGMRSRSRAG
jgi:hypothetical protein